MLQYCGDLQTSPVKRLPSSELLTVVSLVSHAANQTVSAPGRQEPNLGKKITPLG